MHADKRTEHPSGDHLLGSLLNTGGVVSDLVQNYPGKIEAQGDTSWLEKWFLNRIEFFLQNPESDPKEIESGNTERISELELPDVVVIIPTRLISVQPNYFRGFRDLDHPIDLSANLMVLDGKNSSGKTSLTEALEWLFSGELERRKMQSQGDPKELENCIANQLMPDDQSCWVECVLEKEDGTHLLLKRVLVADYGATYTSTPESHLFLNGKLLDHDSENTLLAELFAGIPPLLMQHSLRSFVLSSPADRRNYFENLLNIDELTFLIEKSVIGKAQAEKLLSPNGNKALDKMCRFIEALEKPESSKAMKRAQKSEPGDLGNSLSKSLVEVAINEFPKLATKDDDLRKVQTQLIAKQQEIRHEALPILVSLKPGRHVDDALKKKLMLVSMKDDLVELKNASNALSAALTAAKDITKAKLSIAESFKILSEASLIDAINEPQVCPLCQFGTEKTLLLDRVVEISSWVPLQTALNLATANLNKSVNSFKQSVLGLRTTRTDLVPVPISDDEWTAAISDVGPDLLEAIKMFRAEHLVGAERIGELDRLIEKALAIVKSNKLSEKSIKQLDQLVGAMPAEIDHLLVLAPKYSTSYEALDKAVGSATGEDPKYSLRKLWLELSETITEISLDIKFETAKSNARKELKCIRDLLIETRQAYLDLRRVGFNDSINGIWENLREDRYSSFSKLHIPKPSGKGFPVKIEVKAMLDDSSQVVEVDALKVFSESQVNVLGIAAFVTRAKLLGHRTIIFDDPVQSMDEDHFNTFASRLIPYLLDEGFHVIILTHNDQFARNVSHACYEIEGYTTMRMRLSRRDGCKVDEGNRRVPERLQKAEKLVEEGKYEEAWRLIRLAIERLYLIVAVKYVDTSFDPSSWANHTGENMWNESVAEIIDRELPSAAKRLKEILAMTPVGAHDKTATGETDLRRAIKDLRSYLTPLGVGG